MKAKDYSHTFRWGTPQREIELTTPVIIGHMPSTKLRCPRTESCGAEMSCRPVEHMLVFECPGCGYECIETNSGMRADFDIHLRRK